MKKLILLIVLAAGVLCLLPAMKGRQVKASKCSRQLPEKELLLPVERLLWMPMAS